jgi:hypothetical protein
MKYSPTRTLWHRALRRLALLLPQQRRFALYRSMVDCDPAPDPRLVLKIAESREEIEACFKLLYDTYVQAGWMAADASGLRVTPYHALPSTTLLCAKFDGEIVGTLSLIREGVFGFPLQAQFDLSPVRAHGGNIAQASGLAVHPKFRRGGAILFPLLKFMYAYCTGYFDTRQLIAAFSPERMEMFEALLLFQRMTQGPAFRLDFVQGAPALGAALDLSLAPARLARVYAGAKPQNNLHHYFTQAELPNIEMPQRHYHTTNDPVMTPPLLDYFFNQRVPVFAQLDARRKVLLHSVYNLAAFQGVLPALPAAWKHQHPLRRHQRFSIKCPAVLQLAVAGKREVYALDVIELSEYGFRALSKAAVPLDAWGEISVHLGPTEKSTLKVAAVRLKTHSLGTFYSFQLAEPDLPWRIAVHALESGTTGADLARAASVLTG